MGHRFSNIPDVKIPRSSFDRSFGHKTTFDAGYLVPVFVDEALPGDTFNVSGSMFARLATPIKPVMDNMFLDTFFFAVPYRLVWENWERFNGAQDNPSDSTDYTVPRFVNSAGVDAGGLHDYMGIPPGVAGLRFSTLPARAYNLIWNEWFRDQNLQDSAQVPTDDGTGEAQADYVLRRRGKRHDYFTSALPWPQKGDPVTISLGATAAVIPDASATPRFDAGAGAVNQPMFVYDTSLISSETVPDAGFYAGTALGANPPSTSPVTMKWASTGETGLQADLSTAEAISINDLREAFQTQRMLERDARGGTRYTEIIRSHFGVISPDQRLQRPEYLGGGSQMINITPIAQTTQTVNTTDTPQGNLAAMGTAAAQSGFTKSFTEHCIIIGLVNVRADLSYQQGLNRMWSRETRYDFFWPSLSMLGEQAILQKEIYADGTAADDIVFGYQERYAEYRYKPSLITGKFRSTDPQSLDIWHLGQEFTSAPILSDAFIQDDPPIDRVIAVQDEPHFLLDSYFSMRCARPMPLYGVPGMIDHF